MHSKTTAKFQPSKRNHIIAAIAKYACACCIFIALAVLNSCKKNKDANNSPPAEGWTQSRRGGQVADKSAPKFSKYAAFLNDAIGSQIKIVPEGQAKSKAQLVLEEIVKADNRDRAKGKWIDDIIVEFPSKPDSKPTLPDKTVYFDAQAVLDHWATFQQRNPKTAADLLKYGYDPSLPTMPQSQNFDEYCKTWFYYMMGNEKAPAKFFVQHVGEKLLYGDFLLARDDVAAKANGYKLLQRASFYLDLDLYLPRLLKSPTLDYDAHMEIYWPYVCHVEKPNKSMMINIFSAARKRNNTKQLVALTKWATRQTSLDLPFYRLMFINIANAYCRANDPTGALVYYFAAFSTTSPDGNTTKLFHTLFIKRFGRAKGANFFRRYMTELYSLPKNNAKSQPSQ